MSEETKTLHTPGPWLFNDADGMWVEPQGRGDEPVICDLLPRDADSFTEEDEANGRLIAAAPELLDACKTALDWYLYLDNGHSSRLYGDKIAKLRAAIARAEGRES